MDGRIAFIPEEERPQYVKPNFLKRVATPEPVLWLPKIQAMRFRLQDAVFEPNTPATSKAKLRAAVPSKGVVTIYQTANDFNAVVRARRSWVGFSTSCVLCRLTLLRQWHSYESGNHAVIVSARRRAVANMRLRPEVTAR
jgi:hypothetical protein